MAQAAIASIETNANAPMASAQARAKGHNVTGQYLIDTFVNKVDNAEITRCALVRKMAENTETNVFKGALKDMVDLATKLGPSKATVAKQRQSELRQAFGAFKHIKEEGLREFGYPEDGRVSYHEVISIARAALAKRNITWEGYTKATPEEKERKSTQRMEQKALDEVQKANPRNANETMQQWLARCAEILEDKMDDIQAARDDEALNKQAQKVFAMVTGADGMVDIDKAEELIARCTFLLNAIKDGASLGDSITPL